MVNRSIKIFKGFLVFLTALFVVLVIGILSLQLPVVQNKLVPMVEKRLSDALETRVEVGYVDIDWPDMLVVEDVTMYDQQGQVMFAAKKAAISAVRTNIWSWIFNPKGEQVLTLDEIRLEEPVANLYKTPQGVLNLAFLTESKDSIKQKTEKVIHLDLKLVEIIDGSFSYTDSTKDLSDPVTGALDFNMLNITDLDTRIRFKYDDLNHMEAGIRHLHFIEKNSKFILDSLQAEIMVGENEMGEPEIRMSDALLKTMDSRLVFDAVIPQTSFDQLTDADFSEKFQVEFQRSKLRFDVLGFFTGGEFPLKGSVWLEGPVTLDKRKIRSKNLLINYGSDTDLLVKADIRNYTDDRMMLMDIDLIRSSVGMRDLQNLLPSVKFPEFMQNFGTVRVDGTFLGSPYEFVANADFQTRYGFISSNLKLKLPENERELIEYSGLLRTENLKFNELKITEVIKSEYMNFDGQISGSGLEFDVLSADLSGKLTESDLFGYHIDTLIARDVSIKNKIISGPITLRDEQGDANLLVKLDLASDIHHYILKGNVANLDLQHYGVTEQPLTVSTIVDANFYGEDIENISGSSVFDLASIYNRESGKTLGIRKLKVKTEENTLNRKNLSLLSSLGNLNIQGTFTFREGEETIRRLVKEAGLYLSNNDSLIAEYYAQKTVDATMDTIIVNASPDRQTNELLEFFGVDLYISPDAQVNGVITTGPVDQVNLDVRADSVNFKGIAMEDIRVDFIMDKVAEANMLLGYGNARIDELTVGESLVFQDVDFEPQMQDTVVDYQLSARQIYENDTNLVKFSAQTVFASRGVVTTLKPGVSRIRTTNSEWSIAGENSILLKGGVIDITGLTLQNKEQTISVSGTISDDWSDFLTVTLDDVTFDVLNDIYHLDKELKGVVDEVEVRIWNLRDKPVVSGTGRINNFSYQTIDSLNILFSGNWSQQINKIFFDSRILFRGDTAVSLTGNYDLVSRNPLDFVLNTKNVPLRWAETFTEPEISELTGNLSIQGMKIGGRPDSLIIVGEGYLVNDPSFFVDYLQQRFRLETRQPIRFTENIIVFPSINVMDPNGGLGVFDGRITHKGFSTFDFDLQFEVKKNFVLQNTTKEDNSLFYGRIGLEPPSIGFITGSLEQIEVTADVIAGKGTMINIPIGGSSEFGRPDYINFVVEDSTTLEEDKGGGLEGFVLNLRVMPTPDATARIIFDEQVGDIIEAKGEGFIEMKITDAGEFEMEGYYDIIRGDYLFTAKNVVNKRFIIQQNDNSLNRIEWTGDPYDANLDIDAVHRVNADISTLLGDDAASGRVPVKVLMHMSGLLSKPDIELAIELDELTQGDVIALASYFKNIKNDEQELNRQVVSLLVFKSFAPASSGAESTGAGTGVTSSISELVSNQLNYWISEAFGENLGVEISSNQFEDVQLSVNYKLGNRVTIERDGTIIGNKTRSATLGNISIQIRILPKPVDPDDPNSKINPNSGQLVMEIFNRENVNITTANNVSRGVGIFYKKDFESIKDLFKGNKPSKNDKPQ